MLDLNTGIEEELFNWLAESVKNWDTLTVSQANEYRLEALNRIEDDLLAGHAPSYELDSYFSVTGHTVIFYPQFAELMVE